MQPLKAHVKNGRLFLDEPTDLPEGTEVDLVSIEHEEPWELSPEQTAELQARLAAADRGELVDGELVLERLRVGL
jgi:hypothetical protein